MVDFRIAATLEAHVPACFFESAVTTDHEPYALYAFRDSREVAVAMHRDGLHIDLSGPPPWPVQITFRCWMEMCPASHGAHLGLTDRAGAAGLPVSTVDGLRLRETA